MKQANFKFEMAKRDAALNLFEIYRDDLLNSARSVADELSDKHGRVTAPQVISAMRDRGLGEALDGVDRRFMGAVFRSGTGWKRIGWEPGGSHGRPVSIWTKARAKSA